MGPETNIHSIRALEKQIMEGNGDIIKLKRTRNSMLNISARVPPEILGEIFVLNLVRDVGRSLHCSEQFEGLQRGSHNFLLVCHHWFQIASHTPELWSFWGNTLQDWKKYHRRWTGATPLDLVLDWHGCDAQVLFDGSLQDAVRIGVMRDTIRQIHLASNEGVILSSIISSLTPNDKSARNENIESIVWQQRGLSPIDVSDFFARSLLSKLRFLELYGNLRISSWDRLASRTTLLTTLSLDIYNSSPQPVPTPTISQLLSILSSNPNLQELKLTDATLPEDADGSTFQVPLHHLKTLSLSGEFRHLFGLLRQLTLPETLDEFYLFCSNPTVEEISQKLGPYMWDYFRCGTRFQDRLEISSYSDTLIVSISVAPACQSEALVLLQMISNGRLPPEVIERLLINLITPIPRGCVVFFEANTDTKLPEELYFMMPKIEKVKILNVELSEGFLQPNPDGPHANMKFFPSLRSLRLEDFDADDGNWGHLIAYLTHQTSGGQMISLEVVGDPPCVPPGVVNEVEALVKEFTYHQDLKTEDGGSLSGSGCSTHEEGE